MHEVWLNSTFFWGRGLIDHPLFKKFFLGVLICASYVLGAADTEEVEKPSVEIASKPFFVKWCWMKNSCYRFSSLAA